MTTHTSHATFFQRTIAIAIAIGLLAPPLLTTVQAEIDRQESRPEEWIPTPGRILYPNSWNIFEQTRLRFVVPTDTAPGAFFPLSFTDSVFASVVTSGAVTIANGGTLSQKSITANGAEASVKFNGSGSMDHVRINSAEGVRNVTGGITLDWCWVEALGAPGDHADGLQCFGGGGSGSIMRNSTFRMPSSSNATAGYFSADSWTGSHTFDHVMFYGSPGLRINVDGGGPVSLNHVYFISGTSCQIDVTISNFTNVFNATIVGNALVVGTAKTQATC